MARQNPAAAPAGKPQKLSAAERRRLERKKTREEAKKQREELRAIERQMRRPTSRWIFLGGFITIVLLAGLVGGLWMLVASQSVNRSKARFMSAYNVAPLQLIRRFAPEELRKVEEIRTKVDQDRDALGLGDIRALYRDAQDLLREAEMKAKDNEAMYKGTLGKFTRLYDEAKRQKVDVYAPGFWEEVEGARSTATEDPSMQFIPGLAIESLKKAADKLEKAKPTYSLIKNLDTALVTFRSLYEETNEEELQANAPDLAAALRVTLNDAESAANAANWAVATAKYNEATSQIKTSVQKIAEARTEAEAAKKTMDETYVAAAKTAFPKQAPEIWAKVTALVERAKEGMERYEYPVVKAASQNAMAMLRETGGAILQNQEKLAKLTEEVEGLFAKAVEQERFFRINRPDIWAKVKRTHEQLPELTKTTPGGDLVVLVEELRDDLVELVNLQETLTEREADLNAKITALEKDPLAPHLGLNFPEKTAEVGAAKDAAAALRTQGNLDKSVVALEKAAEALDSGLIELKKLRVDVLALRKSCEDRTKRFGKGMAAFRNQNLRRLRELRQIADGHIARNDYVRAGRALEQTGELIPQERFTREVDGTVIDNEYGMMWVFDGASAAANGGKPIDWYDALTFVQTVRVGGFTDWRIPSEEELQVIAKAFAGDRAKFFPNVDGEVFWSEIPSADPDQALAVIMEQKQTVKRPKKDALRILPVRTPLPR